jgi:hypothetical protein
MKRRPEKTVCVDKAFMRPRNKFGVDFGIFRHEILNNHDYYVKGSIGKVRQHENTEV